MSTASGAAALRRPLVLIVDDDPNILDFLSIALDDEGFDVATTTNGAEALEWLDRHSDRPPAVVILDLWMPVMDGRAFLRGYRARPGPLAAVIALTAAQYDAAKSAGVDAEAFLPKPFSLDDLIEVVKRFAAAPSR